MNWKKILTHVACIIVLIIAALIYFYPVTNNKVIPQSDMMAVSGMNKAMEDYHKTTGKKSEWTPNMFSGMPSYQIDYPHKGNIMDSLINVLNLGDNTHTLGVFFLLALGFYIFMVCMGVKPWLSVFAGLIYALGSYNIILIDVGHITKAWAMSMVAPILGAMVLVFKQKYSKGFILFCLSLAMQLTFNHIQITYYTLIAAIIIGISFLVFAIKEKTIKEFLKSVAVLILGAVVSFIPVSGHMLVNNEYVKHTMRGGSELTIKTPNKQEINSKGLDVNYAFNWSYGKNETMTILIPDYMGGGSADSRVGEQNSKILQNRIQAFQNFTPKERNQNQLNQAANQYFASSYYGEQPFTAGPVYFGSIVVFLCLLGFLVLDNKWRWWLLAATIVSIMLSWGKNLMWFNGWVFEHLPLYNKFRTPSMALILANVTMCMAAFLGLNSYLNTPKSKKKQIALYISAIVVGAITLLAAIIPSLFSDFSSSKDVIFDKVLGPSFTSALQDDRQAMFVSDARRSLLFITIAFLCLFFYDKGKINKPIIVVCVIGLASIIDLWTVDRRYINKDTFRPKSIMNVIATNAENNILQQTEKDSINHYRVYNLVSNPFNESNTSYYLPSIGGYSPAKLQRYQDIIDFYLTNTSYKEKPLQDSSLLMKNPLRQFLYQYKDMPNFPMPNMSVLNMLDTRYVILSDDQYVENTEALGAAWFVKNVNWVNTPDEEIMALENFDAKQTAVINKKYKTIVPQTKVLDTNASVILTNAQEHDITHLKYTATSTTGGIVVFSEVFYEDSWTCYLDGKKVPYLCADYILRSVYVPQGTHTIEFVCSSQTLSTGNTLSYIGSSLLVIFIVLAALCPYFDKLRQRFTKKKEIADSKEIL